MATVARTEVLRRTRTYLTERGKRFKGGAEENQVASEFRNDDTGSCVFIYSRDDAPKHVKITIEVVEEEEEEGGGD